MQPAAPTGVGDAAQSAVIEVDHLVRRFGDREAVAGVSFQLAERDSLCVFGPNGAGKSTLLRVLAGILRPSAGRVRIRGMEFSGAQPNGNGSRGRTAYVGHGSALYGALTPLENVEFAAKMHALAEPRAAAEATLERMGANPKSRTAVRLLSRGQQQRISIARALVHSPDVVLLDEPFAGLDDAGSGMLAAMLGELRTRGATLVVVTHNLSDGLSLGTHAAIMLDGKFAHFAPRGSMEASQFAPFYRKLVGRAE